MLVGQISQSWCTRAVEVEHEAANGYCHVATIDWRIMVYLSGEKGLRGREGG